LFGKWLHALDKNVKGQIRVGFCALLKAIWHVQNDFIFNKLKHASFLQVILLASSRSIGGYVSNRNRMIWILSATIQKLLHVIDSVGVVGSLIACSHINSPPHISIISF
jgi:hypothetical protein